MVHWLAPAVRRESTNANADVSVPSSAATAVSAFKGKLDGKLSTSAFSPRVTISSLWSLSTYWKLDRKPPIVLRAPRIEYLTPGVISSMTSDMDLDSMATA